MALATVVQPVMAHLTMVLVSAPPGDGDPASGKGPEWGKAAPIGLLIWLLMGLALFFLIKSMNRNLRKVPASFDTETPSEGGHSGQYPDVGDGAGSVVESADGGDDDAGTAGSGERGSVGDEDQVTESVTRTT